MSDLLVCGGGLLGLATALLLADDGHRVVVLEQDPHAPPPPGEHTIAWEEWERRGVPQFRQPHNLFPLFQRVLDAQLPGVRDLLLEAGCVWRDPMLELPPSLTDRSPRPGDERFRFLTGRRPVVEAVFADAAARHEGIEVRRGVSVDGLLVADTEAGVPRVTGVRDSTGTEHRADLVLDVMGRGSPAAAWVRELLRPVEVESRDRGFAYYSRYFRGELPPSMAPGLSPIGSISLLTIAGDNGTWSVTVLGTSADKALKAARDAERFTRLVRACPCHAHWLEGEPITGVLPMAGNVDSRRRFVRDGQPAVTGLLSVADAWACTNPSAGRGLSVGLVHAELLRDVLRRHDARDPELPVVWDAATDSVVGKWFVEQQRVDAARIAEMDALRERRDPPQPDPEMAALAAAAGTDPLAFRAVPDIGLSVQTAPEVLGRPEVSAALEQARGRTAPEVPGPGRAELEALLA